CAALVGLLALAQSAGAEPKTARQCNSDWVANKTAIQASGKTKRAFVAEGRGITGAPRQSPLDKGQDPTQARGKTRCPSDAVVWVNPASKVYHPSGSRSYGKMATGAYMCEQESIAAGFRAPKLARRPAA